jgi:putative ABC transport system permease protein
VRVAVALRDWSAYECAQARDGATRVLIALNHDIAAGHDIAADLRLGIGLIVLVSLAVGVLALGRVQYGRSVITASIRAAVQLAFVAAALRGVFAAPALTIVVLAVMFGVATYTAASRLKTMPGAGRAVVISCAAGSGAVIGIICGAGVLDQSVRVLVAVSGIVFGGAMSATTLAGRHLREGMLRRRDEIEAWLSIGATMRQAVTTIARTAAAEALVPALDQTRTVGLVTLPGAFVGALLGGASATDAAKFQVVVLVGLLCAEAIAVVSITYLLGSPTQIPEE